MSKGSIGMPPKFGTLQIIRKSDPRHHNYVAPVKLTVRQQLEKELAEAREERELEELRLDIARERKLKEKVAREREELINPQPARSKGKGKGDKPRPPKTPPPPPPDVDNQEEDRLKLSRPRTTVKDGLTEMDFDVNGFSLSEDHLGEIADTVLKLVKKYKNLRHKGVRLIFQSSEDEFRREDVQFLEGAGELTREKILEKLENFLGRMIASTSAGFWILANIELNGE